MGQAKFYRSRSRVIQHFSHAGTQDVNARLDEKQAEIAELHAALDQACRDFTQLQRLASARQARETGRSPFTGWLRAIQPSGSLLRRGAA